MHRQGQLTIPDFGAFAHLVKHPTIQLKPAHPLVVGCFGDHSNLTKTPIDEIRESCDLVEIRLDLLAADPESLATNSEARPWQRLHEAEIPLLFTARRASEGGAGDFSAEQRMEMLREVLDQAALIDIEVASIPQMKGLIDEFNARSLPWIGSFHDFEKVPSHDVLSANRMTAQNTGASGFKAALEIGWDMDQLTPLALFLQQSPKYPISLMAMGPLAPVSRLLFAQLGSVLNYGYLGTSPTAPGQWSAHHLKTAIEATEKAD